MFENVLENELNIPKKYYRGTSRPDRFVAIIPKTWLRHLLVQQRLSPSEFDVIDHANIWDTDLDENNYVKVFIVIYEKFDDKTVTSLPRSSAIQKDPNNLLFSQLLHYVSKTNYKNLWKYMYKKHMSDADDTRTSHVDVVDYNTALKDVITRCYNCPIINAHDPAYNTKPNATFTPHMNLPHAQCCVETSRFLFTIHLNVSPYTLYDCVTFSTAVLSTSNYKPLFIAFQLLQLLRCLHDRGLSLGEITLDDVHLRDDLWIEVFPRLCANLCVIDDMKVDKFMPLTRVGTTCQCCDSRVLDNFRCTRCGLKRYDSVVVHSGVEFARMCELWVTGQISNFTYLTAINNLAGRKLGDPACHHVFPWVTDFTSRCGSNWRDLTKSKYRLNKGDRQLDLTYEGTDMHLPAHHVSEVLSPITYYVYMARRTPKEVLCKHVRSLWVPGEYPNSIQRMQEWSPDECIPEYFHTPAIFKSTHEDMPDLNVPPWSTSPEDFIDRHRDALESAYVSERLHHWIDLTFGYKLHGAAAVKSKNVCLQLVDNHRNLTKSGVVQVFNLPHPPRKVHASPWHGRLPLKIHFVATQTQTNDDDERALIRKTVELRMKNEASAAILTKRVNLTDVRQVDTRAGQIARSTPTHIFLPKDFQPTTTLASLEIFHAFRARSFARTNVDVTKVMDADVERNAFLNRVFDAFETTTTSDVGQNRARKISKLLCRFKDLQIIACVCAEMFNASRLRLFTFLTCDNYARKMDVLRENVATDSDAFSIRYMLELLLDDPERFQAITSRGLPPPSPHQLLQSLLSNTIFPFPSWFWHLYDFVADFARLTRVKVDVTCHVGRLDENVTGLDDLKTLNAKITSNVDNLTIKHAHAFLNRIETHYGSTHSFAELKHLTLAHVIKLFENPPTAVQAFWYLFEPTARLLGPEQSQQRLLKPLVTLYTCEMNARKMVKLYHHTFLIQLIVAFGLRAFLTTFIAPIVEAVGACRDDDDDCQQRTLLDLIQTTDEKLSPVQSRADDDNIAEVFVFEDDDEKTPTNDVLLKIIDDIDEMTEFVDGDMDAIDDDATSMASITSMASVTSVDGAAVSSNVKSPTIPMLKGRVKTISCSVGSKEDEFLEKYASMFTVDDAANHVRSPVNDPSPSHSKDVKISEVSFESVVWLAHRLGPVLTCRYLSRNLLRMLTLCYYGLDNQTDDPTAPGFDTDTSIIPCVIIGDGKSRKVLECLSSISGLYGPHLILIQYIPHMIELLTVCERKIITQTAEAGLITCPVLVKYLIPHIPNATFHQHIDDIAQQIIAPCIRILADPKIQYPHGHVSRRVLARKLFTCLYHLMRRVGVFHLKPVLPLFKKFFLIFDTNLVDDAAVDAKLMSGVFEVKSAFTAELAHDTYTALLHFVGDAVLCETIENLETIRGLWTRWKTETGTVQVVADRNESFDESIKIDYFAGADGPGASTISEIITEAKGIKAPTPNQKPNAQFYVQTDEYDDPKSPYTRVHTTNPTRHLLGNWLAYWEHELGRAEKDVAFNWKQMKLQTFAGHVGSIRCMCVLNNENSFLSGSRDKTIKLWSLRSQGDGTSVTQAQWTYTLHKKSINSVVFVDRLRLVASCDGNVHIWDPFLGSTVAQLDSSTNRMHAINLLRGLTTPSCTLLAASMDGTVKVIDARLCSYVMEYKLALGTIGIIRCMATSACGKYVAVGHSTGNVNVLDLRAGGRVVSTWRGHENEILQLIVADNACQTVISSGLDQNICVWNLNDGKLRHQLRVPSEPVHCLCYGNNQLIFGTTANKVGVYSSIVNDTMPSIARLRSGTMKGVLTSMSLLPLNKLLLVGADNGNINLLC